jgi:hypothetical protein
MGSGGGKTSFFRGIFREAAPIGRIPPNPPFCGDFAEKPD